MLLADVAAATDAVAATRSRLAKRAALAGLLRAAAAEPPPGPGEPDGIAVLVGLLLGAPRQGRHGVGWATLSGAVAAAPPAERASATVLDLDAVLEDVVAISGPASVEARRTRLVAFLGTLTADEQRLVQGIVLGWLQNGALAGTVADAVAEASGAPLDAVRRAAMLSGDLPTTAALALRAEDPRAVLGAVALEVGRFVQPMLASTAADVATALAEAGGPVVVDWKLDGARLQLHRDGGHVRAFTRNGNDVAHRLGGVVAAALALPAARFVLDGEVLGMPEEQEAQPFQDTISAFARQDGQAGGALVARWFDALHVDGRDLVDEPLTTRLEALDALAGAAAMPRIVTSEVAEADAFAADALARGHEGVMVKAVGSAYEAGRRGGAWRKVKPVRTLDLVVLAAEWGSGRRQGWLSNLHLGARGDAERPWYMVGKTFKGLTDALLTWQTEQLLAREVRRSGIVVHVRPELVVEIALDGVQRSTRYPGGVALRFARVRRYRDDKDPADADHIDAVRALLP